MAVVIRLTRRGRMHAPFYRIGVFDAQCRRDGAAIVTSSAACMTHGAAWTKFGWPGPMSVGAGITPSLKGSATHLWR